MSNFTPFSALWGGLLIGAASILLLYLNGRVAGVSGIMAGAIRLRGAEGAWRRAFLAGLVFGAFIYALWQDPPPISITSNAPLLAAAGLLVGIGTRLGNGCTSGHGICGIGRLSVRSLVATVVFLAVAMATVYVVRHVIGS